MAIVILARTAPDAPAQPLGGDFLVKYRDGAARSLETSEAPSRNADRRRFQNVGWERLRVTGRDGARQLEQLRRDPNVLAVEPNSLVTALPEFPTRFSAAGGQDAVPASGNDPLRSVQWALTNIGAAAAWQITTGSAEVVVAVIDTGVNYRHEDLAANIWSNPDEIPGNGLDDDGNGYIDDVHGIDVVDDGHGNDGDPFDEGANHYFHGSLVAGIIGARAQNGTGVAGLNHAVKLMAVRAIRTSNAISLADELEALEYVLAMKRRGVNIRVVNMSYGGLPFSHAERDAIAALTGAGVVVCAAAGNSARNNDTSPFYPSSHAVEGLIAVAAVDARGNLAKFPVHGASHWGRTSVDLAAPGLDIVSTFGPATNAYETRFFGTSAATPHVSGAAALLLAANPAARPAEVRQALMDSVDRLPALAGKVVSQGRLNIARALEHPLIAVGPPSITRQPLAQSVVLSNRLVLDASVFGQHPRVVQWFRGETALPGATNLSLTMDRIGMDAAGGYWMSVSNPAGCATSLVATVTVVPLRIVSELADQSARAGAAVKWEAKVEGPGPLRHQWFFDNAPVLNATNAKLKLTKLKLAHDGTYAFIASNCFGSVTSAPATLTVLMKAELTFPVLNQTVAPGEQATFGVGFTGNPGPFTVQWQKGSVTLASNVVEGTQGFFALPNVQAGHAGSWRVTVRNRASPSGTRQSFTLKLLTDADRDGLPDVWERAFGYPTNLAQNGSEDRDGDGVSDRDEYRAGTNPTNASSRLAITGIARSTNETRLTFVANPNRTYSIERRSDNWEGGWERVTDVPATKTNRVVSVTDTSSLPATDNRFYRVVTPRRQ